MKAILALSGYGDVNTRTLSFIEHEVELSGKKDPNVIYLPTAGFDGPCEDDSGYKGFYEKGYRVKVLRLSEYEKGDKELEKLILSADIICAGGGNLPRILDEFKRTGADELIKQAYENGCILAGSSAGAMCWFERGYDSCGLDGSYMFVQCLGLIPGYCFSPHFNGGTWYTFAEAVKQQKLPGIAAEDGAAVQYKDGVFSIVKEMEDRNVYLFHPDNGHQKVNLTKEAPELNK